MRYNRGQGWSENEPRRVGVGDVAWVTGLPPHSRGWDGNAHTTSGNREYDVNNSRQEELDKTASQEVE